MSGIQGVNIPGPVVPYTENDVFETHRAKYGRGGWRTVADTTERDSIPFARLELYMIVVTANDGKEYKLTTMPAQGEALNNSHWTEQPSLNDIDGGTW